MQTSQLRSGLRFKGPAVEAQAQDLWPQARNPEEVAGPHWPEGRDDEPDTHDREPDTDIDR